MVSKVLTAIKRFKIAKLKAGNDCVKLSLIFNLTIKPPNISKNNPVDAKNKRIVL